MRLLIILIVTAGLFLLPMGSFGVTGPVLAAVAAPQQNAAAVKPPPVAPALVREGDFALKLAEVLNLGTPQSETAAESMLAAVGIAPANGWISDYPITPRIITQLRDSIRAAASSGKLAMSASLAMAGLKSVSDQFGLNIAVAGAKGQTVGEPAPGSSAYVSPTVVDNYYYDYGPPVITYYPPPGAYLFLYAWVPSPFWLAGFYFPGFFILNDFDTLIVVHHRRELLTNHIFDHREHRFFLINPVDGRHLGSVRKFPHFNRIEAGKSGEAIYRHAWEMSRRHEHGNVPKEFAGRNLGSSGERLQGVSPHSRGAFVQPMNRSREESHFLGENHAGINSNSERSYQRSFSAEPHGRMGSYGNRESFSEFHGGRFAGVPNRGGEHGFGEGFHGRRFGEFHEGFGGFHSGHFGGAHSGGGHGFGGGFHSGHFGGAHSGGGHGFGGGFHGGGFKRG